MKRSALHRLLSAFLALLVLTSSVGLTVQRHTCRQSGHTTAGVIFSTPRHGCPPPQPGAHQARAALKSACCDFSAHLHKLDAAAADVVGGKLLPAPFVALLPAPGWQRGAPVPARSAAAARWHAADSPPPPRSGRALLAFVCTLVV